MCSTTRKCKSAQYTQLRKELGDSIDDETLRATFSRELSELAVSMSEAHYADLLEKLNGSLGKQNTNALVRLAGKPYFIRKNR